MKILVLVLVSLLAMLQDGSALLAGEAVSGYDYLQPDMQAMQDDLFSNPGMLVVEQGKSLFSTPGKNGKSCADCHGKDGSRLDAKHIARYPVYSDRLKQPVTLHGQIQYCWKERLGNSPIIYQGEKLLPLESFVRYLARGESVNVDAGGALAPYYVPEALRTGRYRLLSMPRSSCRADVPGPGTEPGANQWLPGIPLYRRPGHGAAGTHYAMSDETAG